METLELPSGRSPRSRAGFLLVLGGAVGAGLLLQCLLAGRLDEIRALADRDVLRARAELAALFRWIGLAVFGSTGLLGAVLALACRKSLVVGVFPPPGVLSWGMRRSFMGLPAQRRARVALVTAVVMVVCSALGVAVTWYAADVLLACRRM